METRWSSAARVAKILIVVWKIAGKKKSVIGTCLTKTTPVPNTPFLLKLNYLSRTVASRCNADESNTLGSGISERRPTRPTLTEHDTKEYRAPNSSADPVLPFPGTIDAQFSECVWKPLVNDLETRNRFSALPKKISSTLFLHYEFLCICEESKDAKIEYEHM